MDRKRIYDNFSFLSSFNLPIGIYQTIEFLVTRNIFEISAESRYRRRGIEDRLELTLAQIK